MVFKKYRKRPSTVEAVCVTQSNIEEIRKWLETAHKKVADGLVIKTLEGDMLASWGDYIVKGVKGEFYPVRRDIFHITYDIHDPEVVEEFQIVEPDLSSIKGG